MPALSGITAVRPTSNTVFDKYVYGATIAAGVPVYLDTTVSRHKASDANLSDAAAKVRGLTMTPGVDGGYGILATAGSVILVGTTLSQGMTYYAGPTAGEIIPANELATGDRVTRIGTAASSTQLDLDIKPTGITHP